MVEVQLYNHFLMNDFYSLCYVASCWNFTLSIRLLEIDSFWTFLFYRKAVAKAKEAHKKHEAEVPFYLPTTCSPTGIL